MCDGARVAHSSRPRTSPEGGKPLEPHHHPCQHPRKNVQRRPSPDPHTTSRRPDLATGPCPALLALHTAEHFVQRVTDCAQSDLDSSLSAQNVTLRTKRYLVHKMSSCTQNVPTHHSHPHDQEPWVSACLPTSRAAPTHTTRNPDPHRQNPHHPHLSQEPQTNPTELIHNQIPHPTHTTNTTPTNKYRSHDKQVPFSRAISTVLTSNKYRSHGEDTGT